VGPAELATENAEKLKSETLKAEGTTDYTDEHGWEQGKAESGNTEKLKLNQESTDQAGQRLAGQAGASESDSLASKLADAPVSESLISSSDGPASSPATSYSQPDTAPEAALALDSGHSTLDSKTTAKPLVFGFYGFARHEQGVDVLMRALEILKDQGEWESEFRIVWPQAFQMPDGSWLEPKMFEHLKERVRFFEKPLSPQEYQEQLSETDWLLLPYRVGSYQGRCSRISIEACVMGIPVIYTNGTDLEEVVANHGAGIGVPEEDADALANAIRLALEENRAFKEKAVVKQVHARAIFSGRYFLEAILAKN
jgi:glycosyltransferase involved in cell wall biosynthesis